MELADFYNLHRGQTCLIVGLGPNLHLTPPARFDYPSFGVNTIYKQDDFRPMYYIGVDERLRLEDGAAVIHKYADVPKFFPSPDWDGMAGSNIYRFRHEQRGDLFIGGQSPADLKALTKWGITYRRIMDCVFQVAYWMGFTTMLMIGVQQKPGTRRELFWGHDAGEPESDWRFEDAGYLECRRALSSARILNISEDTYVSEDVLPRDDWRKWANVTLTPAPQYTEQTVTL
jgi:hypothetical protein